MKKTYYTFINKFYKQLDLVQRKITSDSEHNNSQFGSFITIARDPGSGGKPIGELVAKRLGFEFYDDKLLEEVARSAKLRKDVIEGIDERQRSIIQDIAHQLTNPDYVSESRYLKHLYRVVLSLAHKGNVVLLGRGTNYIVPKGNGLHIRITAPYRVCVSRAAEHEGIDYQTARDIIRKVTSERAGFVKQYFGKDIRSAKYYDLTVNTHHMSLKDAASLIELAFRNRYSTSKRK